MKNFKLFILALGLVFAKNLCSQTFTFTTPGTSTWTVPTGVNSISIYCWGAGGAGGSVQEIGNGSGNVNYSGYYKSAGGGGSGGFNKIINYPVTPGQVLNIIVGAGGTFNTTTLTGGTGGNSSINVNSTTILTATGGSGGVGNSNITGAINYNASISSGGIPNGASSSQGGVSGSSVSGGKGGNSSCNQIAPYPCYNQSLGSGIGGLGGAVNGYACFQGANGANGQNRGGGGGGAVTTITSNNCSFTRQGGNGGNGAVVIFISKINVPSITQVIGACQGSIAEIDSFYLSGNNVDTIHVKPPLGLEVSLSPNFSGALGTFGSPLNVIANGGYTIGTQVYMRLQSTSTVGTNNGNIICYSNTAQTQIIPVTMSIGSSAPQITSQPYGQNLCAGSTGQLNIQTSIASYTWQYLNGTIWTNVANNAPNNFQYQYSTTDSMQVTYNNSNTSNIVLYYRCIANNSGCKTVSDSVQLTILPLPTISVISSGSTVFCQGGEVNLNANPASGLSYQWYKNSILIPGEVLELLSAASSGSYTVLGTNTNGCSKLSTATIVTVRPLPSAIISNVGSTNFCDGIPIILSANTGTGLTYQWKFNDINIPGQTATSYTASAAGSYSVVVTNNWGCTATSSAVLINPLPNVNITSISPATICLGQSIQNILSVNQASNYQWNIGDTTQSIVVSSPGIYSVSVIDSNGCQNTDSIQIIVNPLPNVYAGNDIVTCQGQSIALNGSGATMYSWNNSVINNSPFTPSTSNTYIVIGTDPNGCQNSDTLIVTVNQLPSVNAGINQSICQGESITLIGIGATTYSWNNNVINNVAFVPLTSNNYIVTGTDSNGCQDKDTVLVTVIPTSSSQLTQTANNTYTLNGQTYSQSGTYTQVIPNANGCDSTITLNLTINGVGINEVLTTIFNIYPNPAKNQFQIDFDGQINKLEIIDAKGAIVYAINESKEEYLLPACIETGYYLVVIHTDEGIFRKELIVNSNN
jgi:hypothetical protein